MSTYYSDYPLTHNRPTLRVKSAQTTKAPAKLSGPLAPANTQSYWYDDTLNVERRRYIISPANTCFFLWFFLLVIL